MPLMGWIILVMVMVTGAWLCAGAMSSRPAGGADSNQPAVTNARSRDMKALSRQQLQKMLQRIATAKPPAPKMGAMCYAPLPPAQKLEYACPTCGEKTIYTQPQAFNLGRELQTSRQLMKELAASTGTAVALDESAFCRKCQPDSKWPALKLVLRFDDGTTRTLERVTDEQVRLLRDFFAGKLSITASNDGELPLKERLGELERLLGEKAGGP